MRLYFKGTIHTDSSMLAGVKYRLGRRLHADYAVFLSIFLCFAVLPADLFGGLSNEEVSASLDHHAAEAAVSHYGR